jgi:DNA replication protein DnaC
MTAPDAGAEVERLCRRLRLPYIRRAAPDVLLTAKAQRWDPAETLRVLLAAEEEGRDRSTTETRRRRAHFPAGKTFEAWKPARSSIPLPTQSALRTLEWITRRECLVVCGPSGTGKSHFCEALGHAAVDAGMAVAWFGIEDLGTLVRRHRVDDSIARALPPILRAELIIVDLCRHRDYPDTWRKGRAVGGERLALVGIVTGCRGRRGACLEADSGRRACWSSSCVEAPGL